MTITVDDGNGMWNIKGKAAKRASGQYINGLAPGTYTVEFADVEGKTKPSNIASVEVQAGEVTTKEAAYTPAG